MPVSGGELIGSARTCMSLFPTTTYKHPYLTPSPFLETASAILVSAPRLYSHVFSVCAMLSLCSPWPHGDNSHIRRQYRKAWCLEHGAKCSIHLSPLEAAPPEVPSALRSLFGGSCLPNSERRFGACIRGHCAASPGGSWSWLESIPSQKFICQCLFCFILFFFKKKKKKKKNHPRNMTPRLVYLAYPSHSSGGKNHILSNPSFTTPTLPLGDILKTLPNCTYLDKLTIFQNNTSLPPSTP